MPRRLLYTCTCRGALAPPRRIRDEDVSGLLPEPPQLPSDIADRIDILGPRLEAFERVMLWIGIFLDLFAKASLIHQLATLAL